MQHANEKLKGCEKQNSTTGFTVIKVHNAAVYWLVIFGANKMENTVPYSFRGLAA